MSYHFLPYEQEQMYLLPPSVQEWVGEDSLARFVSDVVDQLAAKGRLAGFYARYREDGWGGCRLPPGDDGEGAAVCVQHGDGELA